MTHATGATGAPGCKPLTIAVVLVVAAHVLVLQASPVQLGTGSDPADAGGKILTTRRIDRTPPSAGGGQASPAPPKFVKTTQDAPKKTSNQAVVQQTQGLDAPEIIATQESPSTSPSVPEGPALPSQPLESAAAAAPTQASAAAEPATGPKTHPVTAISLPGSVRLLYKMIGTAKNLNYHADAELAWKTDGDSYQAMMKVSAFLVGSRSMTSVGKITPAGLAPTRFADKFRTELAAHFEADKGKITFSANTPDAPWVEGAQDRVSVFLQLGGMLAARPQDFPPGSNITFLTIGPREADTWTFVIEAEESLNVMSAQMPTLKLTRKPRREFDQKVEIWFAPSLGYLPVRNRITQQNGDFIDQQLVEVVKNL
ncbi:MAG: DUF3108 domain-containing protein [Polaromonas sp.]|jgi:hypothetical protein